MGHLNQSVAFAKYLNASYDIVEVRFKYKFFKALSYLLDKIGIYTKNLFEAKVKNGSYDMVIGTGSDTYYATKIMILFLHKNMIMHLIKVI